MQINPLIVALISALVTGAIAIASSISSLWFASRLTRVNEDRKWRRDHALEAYSEFNRIVDTITTEASSAYLWEDGTEEYRKHAANVIEKLSEMYRATDRIILLSSNEVQAPFGDLTKYVPQMAGKWVQVCPKVTEAEIKAARAKLSELQARFLMYARNDLEVHAPYQLWNQMPKRPWWRFSR